MQEERRKKERRKLETCQMCGKQLTEDNMFWKKKIGDKGIYLCCQTCYEQFTGKPYSSDPEIEFK